MRERILDVFLKNNYVGQLKQKRNGDLTFTYSQTYLSKARVGISISLPLRSEEFERQCC